MMRYPLVLIGAGPANLAVLIYLEESLGLRLEDQCIVLEAAERPQWHAGLCSTQTTLQISMLKDLVCLRDPTSRFTFINFLKQRGLLRQYAHLNTFYPSRELYSQYLAWVCEHFASIICFGRRVKGVSQRADGSELVFCLDTESVEAAKETYLCRQLLVAIGREPYIPPEADVADPRIFHSAELLFRLNNSDFPVDGTYVVLGAGQSAGEVTRYLFDRSPRAHVHVVSTNYLFRQIDDNPFVNDLYSDAHSTDFYALDATIRQRRLSGLPNTNYGVVDSGLARELYRIGFDRAVSGLGGLRLHAYSKLSRAEPQAEGLRVTITELDRNQSMILDNVSAVICATGYRNSRAPNLLGDLLPSNRETEYIETDEHFEVKLARGRGLFALNHGSGIHGLTEGTMTTLAERAERVGNRLDLKMPNQAKVRRSMM